MTTEVVAAVSTTAVCALVSLVLGWAALHTHGRWLQASVRADRSESIGDQRGHRAAQTQATLLRRQARTRWLATLTSVTVMVAAAVVATVAR